MVQVNVSLPSFINQVDFNNFPLLCLLVKLLKSELDFLIFNFK